jgi:hypothetical protein
MDTSALVIALLLIGGMSYVAWMKWQRDNRAFYEQQIAGRVAFDGEGDQTTPRFHLDAGRHKLIYWFPEDALVEVELFSASGEWHEVIAIKKGEGQLEFAVPASGLYIADVEPAEPDVEWAIEISRLGLPSQRG